MYSVPDRPEIAASVLVALTKSRVSIDDLIASLSQMVSDRPLRASKIKEVA
jgi:hypothetical protein